MKLKIVTGIIVTIMMLGVCACGQKGTAAPVSSSKSEVVPSDSLSSEDNASATMIKSNSEENAGRETSNTSVSGSEGELSEERKIQYDDSKDVSEVSPASEVAPASEAERIDSEKKSDFEATGDVLIDADGFYAVITNKKTDESGYSWDIHCENNTGNTVYFGMENVSVNGIMVVPLFQAEVEQGSSADETATWNVDLKEYGIDTPVIIEGKVSVIDKDSYALLSQVQFTVCPEGANKAYYVNRPAKDTDLNIISDDYADFLMTSFLQDEYGNAVMSIYLNNKSDKDIILSIDGCFINDAEADPFWAAFLPAGKSVYSNIFWSLADLQSAGIDSLESINKIVAEISIYDQESYEVYDNQLVTLNI